MGPLSLEAIRTQSSHNPNSSFHRRTATVVETDACLSLWDQDFVPDTCSAHFYRCKLPCLWLLASWGVSPQKPCTVERQICVGDYFRGCSLAHDTHFPGCWTSVRSKLLHGTMMKIKIWTIVLRLKYQNKTSTLKLVTKRILDSDMASGKARKKKKVLSSHVLKSRTKTWLDSLELKPELTETSFLSPLFYPNWITYCALRHICIFKHHCNCSCHSFTHSWVHWANIY